MCFIFGDDRFRGLASAEGQILSFPIDFDGRPYNTLTLPCERVISNCYNSGCMQDRVVIFDSMVGFSGTAYLMA